MIAFCCVTCDDHAFRAAAAASLQGVIEGDSLLMRHHGSDSFAVACNEMLAQAGCHDDLEAAIMIDQDTRIEAADFLTRLRSAITDHPDFAVIGAAPAREVPGLVPFGQTPRASAKAEVYAVDGALIALSPRGARELRFDLQFAHSVDASVIDLCLQARGLGGDVLAVDLGVQRPPIDVMDWESTAVALHSKWGPAPSGHKTGNVSTSTGPARG